MMVVMLSQAGTCFVGVNYDTASVTEPDLFETCLRAGFDEVTALGKVPTDRRPRKAASGSPGPAN
jgi:hypothetical protein